MPRQQELAFPETEAVLGALYANYRLGFGEHIDSHLTAGDVEVELGAEPFDPAFHDPADIDFTLEEGLMDGELYVPTGLVTKPLVVNIAQDLMTRAEDARMNKLKSALADQVIESVLAAMPQTDPVNGLVVSDAEVNRFEFMEVAQVTDRPEGVRRIEGLALNGLSIVVSDFKDMEFAQGSLKQTVAIKVNHSMEREFPEGKYRGVVVLGKDNEINAGNRRAVRRYNQAQSQVHQSTVEGLEAAGATVVSLTIDGAVKPHGFDPSAADQQIAKAVASVAG